MGLMEGRADARYEDFKSVHVSNSVGICGNGEEARGAGDEAAGGANRCIKLLIILFSWNCSKMKFLP